MSTNPATGREEVIRAMTEISAWYLAAKEGSTTKDEPPHIQAARLLVMEAIAVLKVGDTDPWLDRKIEAIVRKSTHYIVYIDDDSEVQWWWVRRPPDMQAIGRIQAEVSRLELESDYLKGPVRSWGWMPWKTADQQAQIEETDHTLRSIRMLIGEAIAIALNGGQEADCLRALGKAEEMILLSKERHCRPTFFIAFFASVVAIGLIHWILVACAAAVCWTGGDFAERWREAAFAGALGAFVSAMLRTRDLKLEPAAGRGGIAVDAVARALIGATAGVLLVMAYDSGLILKAAVEVSSDKGKALDAGALHALRIFLAIAAGSSERLLPSLVERAEALVAGTSGSKASKPTTP